MNDFPRNQTASRRSPPLWVGVGTWLLLGLFLTGCRSPDTSGGVGGSGHGSANVYAAQATLPEEIRRVAVLPLVTDERFSVLVDGREALDPVLTSELLKTKRFEVIRLTPLTTRTVTGQPGWSGAEVLPAEFFAALRESSACDAVLFCELTLFRAYPPLAVGWRMKLVDARSGQVIWMGDETFDAGQSAVKNGARRYQSAQQRMLGDSGSDWRMENSPRSFGQYSVAKLLDTLPAR